jgi:hypothetical protein
MKISCEKNEYVGIFFTATFANKRKLVPQVGVGFQGLEQECFMVPGIARKELTMLKLNCKEMKSNFFSQQLILFSFSRIILSEEKLRSLARLISPFGRGCHSPDYPLGRYVSLKTTSDEDGDARVSLYTIPGTHFPGKRQQLELSFESWKDLRL